MSSYRRTVVGDVVPGRGAIAFAWAVSIAVFGLSFVATLVVTMLLVSPVAMRADASNPLGVQWDSWASWLCLGLALLVGTLMITAGGGSGLVWKWAELRVLDGTGAVASWPRRALRPLVLGVVVLAVLAVRHDTGGALIGIALVGVALGTSLAAADRRGVMERALGLRDVTYGQVPAPDDHPVTT
ncbi:hypothetical protein [Longivirga aurantiaca]|uniref:RDD domain-containing protein n=1 Tax=Longivirga aurantiaca TaxID=1837743 RepID=A0ABW1SZ29_9ACTN